MRGCIGSVFNRDDPIRVVQLGLFRLVKPEPPDDQGDEQKSLPD